MLLGEKERGKLQQSSNILYKEEKVQLFLLIIEGKTRDNGFKLQQVSFQLKSQGEKILIVNMVGNKGSYGILFIVGFQEAR